EIEASFQRTVGDTSLTFEQFECLGEDFIKGHGHPSRCRCSVQKTVWEWNRPFECIYTAQRCQRKAGSPGSARRSRGAALTATREEVSRVRGHPSPGIDPHAVQEHTMSPHIREALGHFS